MEKGLESILGSSPSPNQQVSHSNWNLISPVKFSLKLETVGAPKTLEICEESSRSEMSSHDLSAEEAVNDKQKLGVFVDDEQTRLASQRDRQAPITGLKTPTAESPNYSEEKQCSEIRLSFFSPTKLTECFVKKHAEESSVRVSERFDGAIARQELELRSQQESSQNFRKSLEARVQRDAWEDNSPNTRDRKYKQMQNEIFNKIQA